MWRLPVTARKSAATARPSVGAAQSCAVPGSGRSGGPVAESAENIQGAVRRRSLHEDGAAREECGLGPGSAVIRRVPRARVSTVDHADGRGTNSAVSSAPSHPRAAGYSRLARSAANGTRSRRPSTRPRAWAATRGGGANYAGRRRRHREVACHDQPGNPVPSAPLVEHPWKPPNAWRQAASPASTFMTELRYELLPAAEYYLAGSSASTISLCGPHNGSELELLSVGPYRQLVAAWILEVKPPATWELERLLCDVTAGASNRVEALAKIS